MVNSFSLQRLLLFLTLAALHGEKRVLQVLLQAWKARYWALLGLSCSQV